MGKWAAGLGTPCSVLTVLIDVHILGGLFRHSIGAIIPITLTIDR
jgi:hypothetical protein